MIINLTGNCNLKCPYCFADNFNNNNRSTYMQYEDYLDILKWSKIAGVDDIRLSGGEPTLHPDFPKILEDMNEFIDTTPPTEHKATEGAVFTNGINFKPYVTKLTKNNGALINVNSPLFLTKEEYKSVYETWEEIANNDLTLTATDNHYYRFGVSCNIWSTDKFYYDYVWQLLKDFNIKGVRIAITTPIMNEKYRKNKDLYFNTMKPILLYFVDQCLDNDWQLDLDCSEIPICYFTKEELKKIKKVTMGKDYQLVGCDNGIVSILPNLNISGCYSELYLENIGKKYYEFDTFQNARNWLISQRKERLYLNYYFKCKDCYLKNSNQCFAGCVAYDTSEIQDV